MTTPRLAAPELSAGQAIPETTVNEQARTIEQGANHFSVKDRDLAAPPGSPADGDCYLVAASATGAWAGQSGNIAFRLSTGWSFIPMAKGMSFWIEDEGKFLIWDGAAFQEFAAGGGSQPYRLSFWFTTKPSASEILFMHPFTDGVTFADEWLGSVGKVGVNPSAGFTLDVRKNGISVGSITISTAGVIAFVTPGPALVTFDPGDEMRVVAPATPDATCANASFTFKGVLG